jgi:hypothetical protein
MALNPMANAADESGKKTDPLLEVLRSKGAISAEESAALENERGSASVADYSGVIELLQKKGLINKKDAEQIQKPSNGQFAGDKRSTQMTEQERQAAQKSEEERKAVEIEQAERDRLSVVRAEEERKAAAALAAEAERLDALKREQAEKAEQARLVLVNETRPLIEVLREQGALGKDEAAQLVERIGTNWTTTEEDDRIAASEDEIEYNRTTLPLELVLADIPLLRQKGVINEDEAERIRDRFLNKFKLERIAGAIDESMRREVQAQVGEKIVPVPEWTKRIKLGGDFRLRYEGDFYDGNGGGYDTGNGVFVNPANPTQLLNSSVDRHQLRIRARLNVLAKINNEVEVGIGLATGNTTNPVSTNTTMGDSLNKKNFLLDLAYLKWTPFTNLTVWGGRFASPWFGSDLVWDPDVNFDGVAFSIRPQLTSTLSLFLTGGAFPIQEIELSSSDKWLYAGQLGVKYRDDKRMTATLAAAIYDFENTVGVANDPSYPNATDYSAPQFQQKGNTLIDIDPSTAIKTAYAAEFRELNIAGSVDLGFWDPIRVVLMADYVNNIGYDSAWVNALTGHDVKKETQGYQFGITVGYPETREFGQWKVLASYKHLEADAVMDAFADSDFHMGGTNAKGWIAGGDLGVGKNVWLSTRWLTSNEISGPPLAVDVFQFNVHARF